MNSKYLVLVPVYNDWKNLSKLISKINHIFKHQLKNNFHLIIINDCSTEDFNIKKLKLSQVKKIHKISLKHNVGSQRALAIGIKYIFLNFKKKFRIIIMDSDGQDNPKGILKMINFADKEKSFSVAANRGQRSEALWFKICYEIYSYFILFFSCKKIRFGNFNIILSEHLGKLLKNSDLWSALPPVISLNLKKVKYITIDREKRYSGNSKMNLIGLIFHALKVFSALRKNILIFSIFYIILILSILLKNFEVISFFLIFGIILLNLSNFLLSCNNKKKFLKNYKVINIIKV